MPEHVPPSHEVALEEVERCPCASCTFYRSTRDICRSGTPDEKAARLVVLNMLMPMVVEAVAADIEAGGYR